MKEGRILYRFLELDEIQLSCRSNEAISDTIQLDLRSYSPQHSGLTDGLLPRVERLNAV